MTSKPTWQARLRQSLQQLRGLPSSPSPSTEGAPEPARSIRVAILGIGNATGGDDAAGSVAARLLIPHLAGREDVLVIDGGAAPENCTGPLRRFRPDLVLLIDAAQMDAPPGAVRWLDWSAIDGLSASTHTLPPSLLARYLVAETGCMLAVIGIQPGSNAFSAPLTPPVRAAVAEVVDGLRREIAKH